ncbi:beta strand repeat-containing protein, partial [Tenacibaculum finnmarkense]|uniref:beta strand repeat-containing protein n=1 Tax=Tenacibaculum finnmarkense TaxID=2781243 RepID=UPI00187B6CCE
MNLSVYKKQVLLVTCLMFLLSITNVFANPYVKNATAYKSEVPFFIEKLSLNKTEVSLSSAAIYNKSYYKLGASKAIKKKETSFFEGMLNAVKGFVFSSKVTAAVFVVGGTGPGDDFDGDSVLNKDDLDDDNDGILDTDECSAIPLAEATLVFDENNPPNPSKTYSNVQSSGLNATVSFSGPANVAPATFLASDVFTLFASGGINGTETITFDFSDNPLNEVCFDIIHINGDATFGGDEIEFYATTESGMQLTNPILKPATATPAYNLQNGTATGSSTPNMAVATVGDGSVNSNLGVSFTSGVDKIKSITLLWRDVGGKVATHGIGFRNIDMTRNAALNCPNTDGDAYTDNFDLDSDNDGCSDAYEAGATTDTTADYQFPDVDTNNDGLVDAVDAGSDGAVDYTPTYAQTTDGTSSCPVLCTDPNKYGDTCDFDGDGVLNKDDLDDDNDGILDTDEGFCSDELTGTWTGSGASWSSSAGGVTVTCSSTFISPASLYSSGNDTFNTTNYWLPNVAGGASFIYDVNWDSAPEGPTTDIDLLTDDQGSGTLTFTFSTPVVSPVLHIDKLGGSSNGMSNSLNFTLVTPNITLKRLSGTDDFEVTGTTIQKTPNLVLIDVNSEALPEVNRGTAAGSVRLDGVFTSVTFNWKGVGFEGNGGDLIEFAVETCASTDTDSDGTPDYLDLDSDNDGCSDALEGAQTTLTLASVDGKGILTGAVDANGVPTIVSGGQADVSGADPAITGGQCDDDGDGVLNKDDICNGFDDKADNDGDLVPDGCDLDDDNDGILDSVEKTCSENGSIIWDSTTKGLLSNTFTASSSTATIIGTVATLATSSALQGPIYANGSGNANIDITSRGGSGAIIGNETVISFPSEVTFSEFNVRSIAAANGSPTIAPNYDETQIIEFYNGTTRVYFDGTLFTEGTGTIYHHPYYDGIDATYASGGPYYNKLTGVAYPGNTTTNVASPAYGGVSALEAGYKFIINEPITKIIIKQSPLAKQDNIGIRILDICLGYQDTDSDGTPDYLDLDSDNDGCSDALEGAQTTLTLASVDGKGILTGAVDANGVPTIVNGGQADVSSTDPAITGGQCDDDGDGVVNKDDKCNGFDDAIDSDTDGVPDGCDLDNDNDGILDSVECGALLPGAVTGIDTNTLTGTFTSSVLSTDFTLTSPSQIELPLGNKIPVEFKSYAGVTEGILAYWDEGNVIPNTFDIKFTLQAPVNGVLNALRIASNAPGSAYGAQNAKKQITLTWPGGTSAVLSDPLNEIVNLTDGAVITSGTILELDSGTNQILNSRWYLDIDLAGVSYPFSLDYHTVSSVLTRYEGFSFLPKGCSDLDGDTLTNNLDLDSDADGCNDVLESGGIDADNDGILDGTGFDADGKVTGGVNGYDGATGNEYKATKLTADFTALTDQTVAEGTATSFTLTSATAETTISYDASNNPVYGTTGNANIGIQYQWYLGDPATGTALTNTGVYSTVTTATLNISDVKGLGGSVYYLKVTHADNVCIESVGSATLSVFDPCKIGAILGTVTANDPDADGINNVCDSDDDNDGISDTDENINNKNPDADADVDGIPLYLDDDDTNAAIGDVNNSIEADFDTDNDGIPNHLDLDADNDGIYDVVEAGGTDTNNDGKADHSGADYSDTGGIPDSAFFGFGLTPTNTNTITGNPADFLNIDSDGDGCSDANEAYNNANTDTNSDGTYGGVITSAEVNANGLVTGAAYGAPNANYTIVSYINSVCYIDICTEAAGTDTDNDDVNDICDVDIDNDGILNENENCNSPVWGTAPLTWIAKDDSGTIKLAGGIDMSIDITTTATGDLDAFGGTALNLSATGTGTFGTLDDLAVLFDPAANQGASPVKIQIDFTKEMYNLNFKITDIDAGGFGFRMDKVTITSDEGNPILTKVSETSSSFTVVNNQATAIRYATSDKDNKGTILVQVPDGAKSITIIYEEVGTVSDPGVRGIGILGDLKYCLDTDNDGTPDSNDLDSDNDGCNDVLESGGIDADNDGILDGTGFDADGKVTGGVNGYDGATGNEYKATKLTADFTALTDQTVTEGTGTSFTLTSAIADEATAYVAGVPTYGTPGNADAGIQYQWYLGDPATGTALTNTGVYTTVTTATLNISDVTGLGGNKYYLKVTHADNVCIESVGSATLTVNNFPVADNDSSTGNVPGADTVVNIIDGDVLGDGTQADPTDVTVALIAPKSGTLNANGTVTVPGEGVWAYNDATGELTFNPDAGFTTDPTDITYTITEIATTLTSAAAIVHVEYTEADPIANDDTNTTPGTPGVDVSIALLPNDKLSDGSQATVSNTSIKLIAPKGGTLNADGTVTIPNEGTWTLDPLTGIVTFDPEPGFTQAPATIDYQLTETSTGLTDNATITAAYTEADPIA